MTLQCPNCGAIFYDGWHCPYCGTYIPNPYSRRQSFGYRYVGHLRQCNKWVALALCIFLGTFGAHKFYEGKKFLGVVYICTLGLLGFGVFIDAIVILFKPRYYLAKH